ncbi:MAG: DUF1707 domain-containing protein [Propionibacteriaceae bacterium]|nr:DUF1707 domain-containing protein [Propionibacteriaceae bacterium]
MSNMVPPRRLRASDADRDAVLQVLQQAHVEGRLSVEELGERQDEALKARYTDQFDELVDDLPAGGHLVAGGSFAVAQGPDAPLPATGEADRTTFTVMSARDVDIEPGTRHYVNFAWWGGDNIDLTRAMGPGVVVTLELHAIMAGHDIYVPEGVRVVDECTAIMAGNNIDRQARGDGSNGAVILKGFLWWAGHDIKLGSSRRG